MLQLEQNKNQVKVSEIISFDVFDTLLTRTTAIPKGIFVLMKEQLKNNTLFFKLNSYVRENFYIIRVESEAFLRKHYAYHGINEITLDEIYDYIQKNYALSDEEKLLLKNLEIDVERKNLIGIQENIERVKQAIHSGCKVVIISDIYHSSETLRLFLTDKDEVFNNIPIYVSSEARCMKSTGELFKYVQSKECIDINKWIHIGDNINSDIKAANKIGIKTEKYNYVSLKDYEKRLLARYPVDAYVQLAIGTAKNIRNFYRKNEKFNLGVSIGGVILYPYVNWVIEQSIKRGINRLYFVMRDGYILKQMCDVLIKEKGLDIQTKLIYGSREAWRAPSIIRENQDIKFMFASAREINTIDRIAARFHINKNELIKLIPEKFQKYKKAYTRDELKELSEILANDSRFLDLVISSNEEQRSYLIEYIKQEMDLSDNNLALVDLAASGRTQNCLVNLIKTFSDVKITSFYSQFNPLKVLSPNFEMVSFYSSPKIRSQMELFCRSLCGATVSYKENNGKVVPVMEDLEGQELEKYGYNNVLEGEILFCKTFYKILETNPGVIPNLKAFLFYFDYITGIPDRETAELIGEIPFSNYYGVEKRTYKCAPQLTMKDIICGYDSTQIQLPNISYIRSDNNVRFLLNIRKKYKSIRKFLFNIEIIRSKRIAYIRFFGLELHFKNLLFGRKI